MTPRERFLTAIRNQIPDRVPASPDISNYIPCKRRGLPFWDIYFYGKVPLWKAYADAMSYFGGEWWIGSCMNVPTLDGNSRAEYQCRDYHRDDMDAMVRVTTIRTPDGELSTEQTCPRFDPPTLTGKPMKNIERDFAAYRWLLAEPTGLDIAAIEAVRNECVRHEQAFGFCVSYPGFQLWEWGLQGGVEAISYAEMDCPHLLEEWCELNAARDTKVLELLLPLKPDYILFGGSGTITLASPALAAKYAIPTLARWSRMCREAGVATMLHSCGRSRVLVDMLCEQTEVDLINPLEIAPMGDVDLAEVKRARGRQIALMGNLHTVQTMLNGTPELVRQRALEAMRDGGLGGGFVLSTGDQCGRETPEENLFTLIQTAREFGQYDSAGRLPAVEEALAEASQRQAKAGLRRTA